MNEQISNELDVLAVLLPLQQLAKTASGISVIEWGCGSASMLREMLELSLARSALGLEADEGQHARNLSRSMPGLKFGLASATSVPSSNDQFDLALMRSNLQRVPLHGMGRALDEMARVLKPGGWLYVSEPLGEGKLRQILNLLRDEAMALMAAQLSLDEAIERYDSPWHLLKTEQFDMPLRFENWDDFAQQMVDPLLADGMVDGAKLQAASLAYAKTAEASGKAVFTQPMQVRLLQKR